MFRKDGILLTERQQRIHIETGRDPLDGSYYVDLKDDEGKHLRAIMTPEKFFQMCAGGLVAMARWGFQQAESIVKGWQAPR